MATSYFALVEQDEGSAFGVSFPDVPGCFSAADNGEEVLASAVQALELHLEGDVAPEARTLSQLKADPDVLEALQSGASLLSVPFVKNERRAVRVNLSLDVGTVSAIDRAAKVRGLTRSAFIAEAALKEVKIA